jgi:hypothetical protein
MVLFVLPSGHMAPLSGNIDIQAEVDRFQTRLHFQRELNLIWTIDV